MTILTSPELITDKETRQRLKASSAQRRATMFELTQRLNPQSHIQTVRRIANVVNHKSTHAGVISTGIASEQDEAARKAEAIRRTLANEPLADAASIEEQINRERRQCGAEEEAIEFLTRKIEAETNRLAIVYSKTKTGIHDQLMKKLGKSMLEAHSILGELDELQEHLIENGCGLRGLCLTLPTAFLGHSTDKFSKFADWTRAMHEAGFLNSIPKAFKP